jgi:hypothetical protein
MMPSAVALRLAQAIRAGTWRCPEDWAQEIDYALERAFTRGVTAAVRALSKPDGHAFEVVYPGADAVLGDQ